ncbi:NifB/NifX family molybdenum-iron cluster-binding protein [Oribacterium sp. WCC10]|uniref:NifB/NifX family molybdenum-iron cluster-binding protein n=1 Tax=Oribacterium sp. WCC10 TaxID=1855343 RepID=UPI0008E45A0D|nr:NifB/NifX family molybdenum-iron cluster-binding protein [Oribacterium sp. WCC10]SFG44391.1 Predicted Fe-Mo cluster-binding protein, NifX family [Oribacterium sp. WCC10]
MKKIAITVNNENDNIYWQFGQCPRFKVFEVNDENHIVSYGYLPVMGQKADKDLEAMVQNDVNVIISEGMSPGVVNKIEEEGLSIEVYAGVKGKADDAIIKYLAGMLEQESVTVH